MDKKSIILAIASDHAAYKLKEFLKSRLSSDGIIIKDYGTISDESVDYPDIIHPLAKAVNEGEYPFAVIMCGSGNGVSMVANKYPNVRAALCWDEEQTILSRQHNNANILSLPGRYIDFELAYKMVGLFMSSGFEGGRHLRRVNKIAPKTDSFNN